MNMYPVPILEPAHTVLEGNIQKPFILTYDLWKPLSAQLGLKPDSSDASSESGQARKRYFALCQALHGGVFTKDTVDQFINDLKSTNLLSHEQINHYIELIRAVAKYYDLSDLQEYPFLQDKKPISILAPIPYFKPKIKKRRRKLAEQLKASPHAGHIERFRNFLAENKRSPLTILKFTLVLKQIIRHVPDLEVDEIYKYLGSLYEKGRQRSRIKFIVEVIRIYGRYIDDKNLKAMTYLNNDGSKASARGSALPRDLVLPPDLVAALKKFKAQLLKERLQSVEGKVSSITKLYLKLETLAPQTVQQYVVDLRQQEKTQQELEEIVSAYRSFGTFFGIKGCMEVGKGESEGADNPVSRGQKALKDAGFTVLSHVKADNGQIMFTVVADQK